MKRYGIGEMGPHLRPCMQEKEYGPWVRWEDVRAELSEELIFKATKEAGFGDIEEVCDGYPEDKDEAIRRVRHLYVLLLAR